MKTLYKTLFIPVVCLTVMPAYAIVNIEDIRIDPLTQTLGVKTSFNLNLNGKNGNSKTEKYALGSRIQAYRPGYTQLAIVNYEYGKSSDVKNTDKGFLHLRHAWYDTDTLFWEVFAQLESDEFKRLSFRSLVGAGARFKLIKNPVKHSAYLGTGFFYSREQLEEEEGTTDAGIEYATRMNIYQVYKYTINDNSRLLNTLFYQPDIARFSDYRLLEKFKFQVDVNHNLSINISLEVSRDNKPPQNVEKTDTSYNTGFEYRF